MTASPIEGVVAFHGTASEFPVFREGSYFTCDAGQAADYARNQADAHGGTPRVLEVRIQAAKVAVVADDFIEWAGAEASQRAALAELGHDAMANAARTEIVPFSPDQVTLVGETVALADLPEDMQDIVMAFLEDHDVVPPARLPTKLVALGRFPHDVPLADGVTDARGPAHARAMIGEKVPPILLHGDTWLDGRHRVWAAQRERKAAIRAIDLSPFIPQLRKDCVRIGVLSPPMATRSGSAAPVAPGERSPRRRP